ncbi:DUF6461 domain-containing protein [Streptomyces sp. NPDC004284]|uniref:DUF6461 domain-containing protein n=1 Tax=Streptomyces sp. NPDC004284 TaxID=3364695 RepID=UPI0036ADEE01
MTTVGTWTLLIEPNGYLGVTEEQALPAPAGASWVSPFDGDDPETDLSSTAAFALAAHLTGVAVTPALFQGTTFTCATVKIR